MFPERAPRAREKPSQGKNVHGPSSADESVASSARCVEAETPVVRDKKPIPGNKKPAKPLHPERKWILFGGGLATFLHKCELVRRWGNR